ncbi:MAG TPA: PAS domain S-box protein [bacterium]
MKSDPAAAGRQPALPALLSLLNRYSLRTLLLASIAFVALFCALVIAFVVASRGVTLRTMDTLINVDNAIAEACLRSNAAMLDARRLEKDFLLNYREFGFDEARSRYLTRLAAALADVRGNMGRIRSLAADGPTSRLTLDVEGALERYRRGVDALADKLRERDAAEGGVYAALQAESRGLEQQARRIGGAPVLSALLALRRAEMDYLDRGLDTDAAAVRLALARLTTEVAAPPGPVAARQRVRYCAGCYLELFERYVRATEELRDVRKEYLRAVQTIEEPLEKLYVGSLARVGAKRGAIERSTRLLGLPVLGVGVALLALTGALALGIALNVTRSVVASKRFAARVASGDLATRLPVDGGNEFASLAASLNTMAESLLAAEAARQAGLAALRESEEKYRSLVETSTDWIWATDVEGRHTYTNERIRDILGIEPSELLRTDLAALLHPEDGPRVRDLLAASRAASRGWRGVVLRWRHRDGTWRWIESNAVPVFDAQGALAGFRGVDRDITERHRLEEELVKAQKLEAIGTLAGGIAHDFNNLLQGLFGYVSLAKMQLAPGDRAAQMLDQAERALGLSVNLTTQLLTFAKGGEPLKRTLALGEVLEDPIKFALSGSSSTYRLAVEPSLWAVEADEGHLAQVIQNVVLNAAEAMPRGGTVEVAARNEHIPAGANALVPAGGDFVRIDVRDSGIGITAKDLTRIFDPYFTTKQRGSGLGLATSYSIVRGHGGFIDVTSRAGEGSVFSIYLPAGGGDGRAEPQQAPAPAAGGTGRILVMDDERLVREVASSMLESLGHAVATAANGEDAVDLYRAARAEGRPFDAVILDLTVKNGAGGEETLRRLRELDPDVRAVVSSGYADATVLGDYRAHGFRARLGKPYRLDALRECLAAVLQASRHDRKAHCPAG